MDEFFSEFNITIKKIRGVSPVGEETKIIAREAAKLHPQTMLDMGCGTGFIAIYLRTLGIESDAGDINESAVALTKENAQKNNISLPVYHSDLFANLTKKYDLITFNAPYGNSSSSEDTGRLEYVKSFIPKGTILTKIFYFFIRKNRKALTQRFLEKAKDHLTERGMMILLMDKYELDLLKERKHHILKPFLDGYIISVEADPPKRE